MRKIKYLGCLVVCISLLISCASDKKTDARSLEKSGNTAALIIDFGDGNEPYTNCFDLGEDGEMNGWEFLKECGYEIVDNGGFACKIGEVGCDMLKCYNCACPDYEDPECRYWSYWHLVDGEWKFSEVGAEHYTVIAGATECWMWGNQNTPPKVAGYSCK